MSLDIGDAVYRPQVDGQKYWAERVEIVEYKTRTKCDESYIVKDRIGNTSISEGKHLFIWKNRALDKAKGIALQNAFEALTKHDRTRE